MPPEPSEGVQTLLSMISDGKITVKEIEEVLKMQSRKYTDWAPAMEEALIQFKSKASISQAEIDAINKKVTPDADSRALARRREETLKYIRKAEGIETSKQGKVYYSVVPEEVALGKLKSYLTTKTTFNYKTYAENTGLTMTQVKENAMSLGWQQSTGFNMIKG